MSCDACGWINTGDKETREFKAFKIPRRIAICDFTLCYDCIQRIRKETGHV